MGCLANAECQGMELYGCKRFIVDFFDSVENIAYEIDGKSHNVVNDYIKEICLIRNHGVRVLRFSNNDIESLMKNKIQTLLKEEAHDATNN